MPDLPWTSRRQMETGDSYLVMASHLPLVKFGSTWRFFRAVSAVRKQLATSEGLVGYTLRARPTTRDYWTLSVWTNEESLRRFMRTEPHAQLMVSLRSIMGQTRFAQWQIAGRDGRPDWATALDRLSSS